MEVIVRKANQKDIDWVIPELKAFSDFYDSVYKPFGNETYAREFLSKIIDGAFFVAEQDGLPIGFIAGLLSPHVFNPDFTVLSELFWWVKEKYRTGRAGSMLLKEYTNYGKKNAQWITMTIENISPVRDESLLKRGFKLQEKSFLMEVL